MTHGYRELFRREGAGAAYDGGQYRPGSFWDIVWTLERGLLDRVVSEQRARSGRVDHLDFACGTGRILAYLEDRCDTSIGIDVSAEMIGRARARVKRAGFLEADITVDNAPVEGRYDLITAFRFLLNAEPTLRTAGLDALARRLKDGRSRLVLNVHGNPFSYKGIVVPIRRVLGRRGGEEQLLALADVETLLDEADLEAISRHGMGLLPAPILERLPAALAVRIEEALSRSSRINRLGVNQVLVCRLKADGSR